MARISLALAALLATLTLAACDKAQQEQPASQTAPAAVEQQVEQAAAVAEQKVDQAAAAVEQTAAAAEQQVEQALPETPKEASTQQ